MIPLFLHPGHYGSSAESPVTLIGVTAASVGLAALFLFGGRLFRSLRRGRVNIELLRWAGDDDPWWAELRVSSRQPTQKSEPHPSGLRLLTG